MQHPKKVRNSDDIHSGRQLHPRSKLLNVLLTSAPLRSSWEIQTKAVLKSIAEMFPLCLNNRDSRALRGRHLPCSSLSPAQCSRNNRDKLQVGTFCRMKTISESTVSKFSSRTLNKFINMSYLIHLPTWSFQKLLVYKYE